jgi:hypothetical protein
MIQNSSDAIFPFTWLPKTRMRIADLTLTSLEEFDVNKYGTMLCQPTDIEAYESNPERFSFPIVYEPETIQAALTSNNSDLIFHISKGKESISRKLTLGVLNSVEFESLKVSFTPAHQNNTMVALNDFSVQRTQSFDYRIIIPLLIAIPILSIAMFYWRRKGAKTSLHDHGNLISSDKS